MYFDIDAHKGCFKTNPDEAYFWHGRTNGCGGQDNAMDIAVENNGKTLEMCMLNHRDQLERAGVEFFTSPDGTVEIFYGSNQQESNKFWEDCSRSFAEQSSGNIHVIEGTDLRPNGQSERDYPNVYNRIEHPALEQNHNVNSITHIDPYTRKASEVELFNQHYSKPIAYDAGSSSMCGPSKDELPAILPPYHSEAIPAGADNPSSINRNAAEAANVASNAAESSQKAAKSLTGGMV